MAVVHIIIYFCCCCAKQEIVDFFVWIGQITGTTTLNSCKPVAPKQERLNQTSLSQTENQPSFLESFIVIQFKTYKSPPNAIGHFFLYALCGARFEDLFWLAATMTIFKEYQKQFKLN